MHIPVAVYERIEPFKLTATVLPYFLLMSKRTEEVKDRERERQQIEPIINYLKSMIIAYYYLTRKTHIRQDILFHLLYLTTLKNFYYSY